MNCKNCQSYKQNLLRLFVRFFTVLVPYVLIYTWSANQINRLYLLFSGEAAKMTTKQALFTPAIISPAIGLEITLPDPIAEAVIGCIVVGVLTYVALKYLCNEEWVQEPVEVQECWTEITWYNPWSWVKSIVCTFTEVLKWVVKQTCGHVEEIVTVLVVACIIIVVAVVALV